MSGHSHWSQIQRQKGAADSKRGAVFTKLGNLITVAVKAGGADPTSNFKLRLAIDQAKAFNMPKENIERAIKRGTGEIGGGTIETVTYEGFGPANTAFIIEGLTDNRNRTSSVVKHILSQYGGSLGGPNAVNWLFESKGIIEIEKLNEDLELELIDAGAQDIVRQSDSILIYTHSNDLKKIKDWLEAKNIGVKNADIEWVAKEKKSLTADQAELIKKIFEELDNNEDVNNYYTNADI